MNTLSARASRVLDRLARPFLLRYREATAAQRVLPGFIIIGTQKGGTTSLFHYLAQHPDLLPSYRKEVHYFDGGLRPGRDNFDRGEGWYRSNFPRRTLLENGKQAFEASPLYIFHPLAPARMHALLPDVRLILLLRDPVERALSHYFHQSRKGRERLPVAEAMAREEERLAPALAAGDYKHRHFSLFSYKLRGHYAEQIRRYRQYFRPEQMMVMGSEEFFAAPNEALASVCRFVGVADGFRVANLQPRNVGSNRTSVDTAVYDDLRRYFQPHNQDLFELLGRRFDWS